MAELVTEEVVNVADEKSAETEAPGLVVTDLVDCVKVIDICSKRGAFEGSELEAVGKLRSRLVTFLNHMMPKGEEESEPKE